VASWGLVAAKLCTVHNSVIGIQSVKQSFKRQISSRLYHIALFQSSSEEEP
jgi:hypothetical protein